MNTIFTDNNFWPLVIIGLLLHSILLVYLISWGTRQDKRSIAEANQIRLLSLIAKQLGVAEDEIKRNVDDPDGK